MTESNQSAAEAPTENPEISEQLGDAGKKAIDAMKAERNAAQAEMRELKKQLKALQERDPLKELLDKLGQKPEPGQDATAALQARIAAMEERAAKAEREALRLAVAAEKGLTPKQAARLQGATREELEADADDLLATFSGGSQPGQQQGGGGPKPDPSQGARGGGSSLDALIAAAQAKGREGVSEVIRLKQEKAAQARK